MEIFDSYGRKCNSRFFVNYGFSLEFNLDNEALMTFELPRNDPQYAIKARHLGFNVGDDLSLAQRDIVRKDFQIPKAYKEKKVKEAFSFLRVLHAQGNEFLIISSADGLRLEDIPPLSIRNETNVLTSLAVCVSVHKSGDTAYTLHWHHITGGGYKIAEKVYNDIGARQCTAARRGEVPAIRE